MPNSRLRYDWLVKTASILPSGADRGGSRALDVSFVIPTTQKYCRGTLDDVHHHQVSTAPTSDRCVAQIRLLPRVHLPIRSTIGGVNQSGVTKGFADKDELSDSENIARNTTEEIGQYRHAAMVITQFTHIP